jgi:hypothetical protein
MRGLDLGLSRSLLTREARGDKMTTGFPETGVDSVQMIRPADLLDYEGPLFVINKTKTIISHDDGKGNVMRIEPVYHRDHVAPLPLAVARHPGFQKLWRTGRVKVTKDPSVEDYLSLEEGPVDMGGILDYTLDAGQNKDLTPMNCLICQELVFLSNEQKDAGVPPLCDSHIDATNLVEQVPDQNNRLVWKIKDTVVKRNV